MFVIYSKLLGKYTYKIIIQFSILVFEQKALKVTPINNFVTMYHSLHAVWSKNIPSSPWGWRGYIWVLTVPPSSTKCSLLLVVVHYWSPTLLQWHVLSVRQNLKNLEYPSTCQWSPSQSCKFNHTTRFWTVIFIVTFWHRHDYCCSQTPSLSVAPASEGNHPG